MALLIGSLIGLDREIRNKPAGLRTHMMVSLGSALFVLIPIQLGVAQENPDALSRVIQGVITGVGFIGAGVILHHAGTESGGLKVRGLTTAAAVWVSSGLGIAAGCGLWILGAIAALLALLTLNILKRFES